MLGLVRPREAAGAQQFAIRMNLCASVDHIKQGVMPLAIVHARAGFQITQPADVVDQPAALDVQRLGVRHPFASGGGLENNAPPVWVLNRTSTANAPSPMSVRLDCAAVAVNGSLPDAGIAPGAARAVGALVLRHRARPPR